MSGEVERAEFVFPDGYQGPLTRFSIADGAIYKNERRVLTLTRIRGVAINRLHGRVRVREVRLRLDDDSGVSFGSYGSAAFGGDDRAFEGFSELFFASLADVSPEVAVDTEAALLPRFAFALFVLVIGLAALAISWTQASSVAMLLSSGVVAFGSWRAHRFRPWDSERNTMTAAEFVVRQG